MLTHTFHKHGFPGQAAEFSPDLAKKIHQSVPSAYPEREERIFYLARPEFSGDSSFRTKRLKLNFLSLNQAAEIEFPITKLNFLSLFLSLVEDQVVNPQRLSRRGPQRYAEYDIVCAGSGKVIVVKVKSTPTVDKILQMPGRLAEFFDFYPDYEGRELIGVFASRSIPENLLQVISKAGLYGIAMGDETMAIVARPGTLH